MGTEKVIQTMALHKHYKTTHALNDLSINVEKGDIYGFLGPNGSGKTTAIKLILGLIKPSSGNVLLQGENVFLNPFKALSKIGSLVETPKFYSYLSAYENMMLSARLLKNCSQKEIYNSLDMVDLSKHSKQKVSTFSLGMKQRLGIALAILNNPEVLILDEPTIALDPQGMKEIRDLLKQLREEKGTTIFISTHILNEVEQICNRVGILKKGIMIYEGKVSDTLNPNEETVELFLSEVEKTSPLLSDLSYVKRVELTSHSILVLLGRGHTSELNRYLHQQGVDLEYLVPKNPSLEDFFIEITKGEKENA
jgi:ABC-type multidrug transport system ATPase subunit